VILRDCLITLIFLAAGLLHSCGPRAKLQANSNLTGSAAAQETKVTLARTVVTPREALTVNELYERGVRRFGNMQYAGAAVDLETAAETAPEQSWAPLAHYQAALARDELGQFPACAEDFRKVVYHRIATPQQRDAQVRLIRVLVYLERWNEAGQEADSLVGRYRDLMPLEAIVARGGRALARLQKGDLEQAQRDIETARSIIEERRFDIPTKIHRDVAVVYFALGELRRRRADAVQFVPLPANFAEQLEQRCQLLLDAQSAYSTSMRAYDAHWSVMAGYRVGDLYAQLHADLMELPAAISFDDPARARLFEAALRLRYSVLLSKAVTLLEHTLAVAARTSEQSSWVALARDACGRLKDSASREQTALSLIPYSRAQLEAALENLRKSRNAKETDSKARAHPM
jgi:tetratricopeptide (TPR) repeat protein